MDRIDNTRVEKPAESLRVRFVIQGSKLDLDAITNALKIEPSYTHRSGEISKVGTTFPHDMWVLTSPLTPKDEPFDAHLKWLRKRLKPSYDFIKSLKASAEIYLRCGYVTESEQSGFTLTSDAVSILTDLGLSMDISILAI